MNGEDGGLHERLEIGPALERARQEQGLSLQQIEEATKIRARYLRDLENENFDVLPAVYVLGSLRTYAGHLGLDGEALVRELKRRQGLLQERPNTAQEEPPTGEPRGLLSSLGRLFGLGGSKTPEGDAGPMHLVGHGPYPGLGALLIFVLATVVASVSGGDGRSSISLVREPTVSQLPARALPANHAEGERVGVLRPENARGTGIKGGEDRPGERAEARDKGNHEDEEVPRVARSIIDPSASASASSTTASAIASAGASARVSLPATAGASAPPEPAANGEPGGARGGVPAAPSSPYAPSAGAGGTTPSSWGGMWQGGKGPVDAALGDRIASRVRSAVNSHLPSSTRNLR